MATLTYDLSLLLDWTRREAGDRLTTYREDLEADGTKRVTINNDGNIVVNLVEVNGTEITEGTDFEMSGNLMVFPSAVDPSTGIYIEYDQSTYTDDEILQYLLDAARIVGTDLHLHYTLNDDEYLINDLSLEIFDNSNDRTIANSMILKLIVYRAALSVAGEKAKQATDDSITIKDGDTSIQTGSGASSQQKRYTALETSYKAELNYARANRFAGSSTP